MPRAGGGKAVRRGGAMRLEGKRALVTGAGTRGMGRAIAEALGTEGADVAVHYFGDGSVARELVEHLRAAGRRAVDLGADLADPAEARALVGRAVDALGGLDVVVCCAAVLSRVPFLELTDAEWDRVHAVNLRGYFAVGQEAARHMAARGTGGRIVMVSSVNQFSVNRGIAHYVATKGGVMQLAKAMALELAPTGITVNLIAPGTIETDLNRAFLADADHRRAKLGLIPMQRIGRPEDVAGAAVFLASEDAAYVTGATIVVDGGLTLE
jgi:NAD(P)-dependent dehydrogenase (short-subunit alcohol dehydrogenase family)